MADSANRGDLAVHLPSANDVLAEAIRRGGGRLAPLDEAEALVWSDGGVAEFPRSLPDHIRWVQLPSAGVESWFGAGVIDRERLWTSAAGAYARTVAEHAVALLLAGVRALPVALPLRTWQGKQVAPFVGTLAGATVAIVGAGGIGRAMIPQLHAFGARVIAVNRSGREVPGAEATYPADEVARVWPKADHVIVAAPATDATKHLVDAEVLRALKPTSWVINIARGSLIDNAALVAALEQGAIGGAALDVTDPEPLPDGHPLWAQPKAIITPHVANPDRVLGPALADHVAENVRRRVAGEQLNSVIDVDAGY